MIYGCVPNAVTSSTADHIKNYLNPPTDQEIYNQRINEWISLKIKEIERELNDNIPFYADGKIERLTTNKLDKLYTWLETAPNNQLTIFNKDKNNMKNNLHIIRTILATTKDINLTLSDIDSTYFKYSSEFDNMSMGRNQYRLWEYCKSIGIPNSSCSSGKHVSTESLAIPRILKQRFFSENEVIKNYYTNLNKSILEFTEISSQIKDYCIDYEYKLFVQKISQSTCPNVTRLGPEEGIPLSVSLTYSGFRPNQNTIYDLNNFKVLQSFKGGILLTPNEYLSHSNNYPTIYVNTSEPYTDQHLFKSGEELVCLSGVKEYTSILGLRKRVHAFKMIPKGKTKYFFLNR